MNSKESSELISTNKNIRHKVQKINFRQIDFISQLGLKFFNSGICAALSEMYGNYRYNPKFEGKPEDFIKYLYDKLIKENTENFIDQIFVLQNIFNSGFDVNSENKIIIIENNEDFSKNLSKAFEQDAILIFTYDTHAVTIEKEVINNEVYYHLFEPNDYLALNYTFEELAEDLKVRQPGYSDKGKAFEVTKNGAKVDVVTLESFKQRRQRYTKLGLINDTQGNKEEIQQYKEAKNNLRHMAKLMFKERTAEETQTLLKLNNNIEAGPVTKDRLSSIASSLPLEQQKHVPEEIIKNGKTCEKILEITLQDSLSEQKYNVKTDQQALQEKTDDYFIGYISFIEAMDLPKVIKSLESQVMLGKSSTLDLTKVNDLSLKKFIKEIAKVIKDNNVKTIKCESDQVTYDLLKELIDIPSINKIICDGNIEYNKASIKNIVSYWQKAGTKISFFNIITELKEYNNIENKKSIILETKPSKNLVSKIQNSKNQWDTLELKGYDLIINNLFPIDSIIKTNKFKALKLNSCIKSEFDGTIHFLNIINSTKVISLESLTIHDTLFSNQKDLGALSKIIDTKNLKHLALTDNKYTKERLSIMFANLGSNKALQSIDFSKSELDENCLDIILNALKTNSTISKIKIDAEIGSIVFLDKVDQIQELVARNLQNQVKENLESDTSLKNPLATQVLSQQKLPS